MSPEHAAKMLAGAFHNMLDAETRLRHLRARLIGRLPTTQNDVQDCDKALEAIALAIEYLEP